ncbi:MAG TPA: hypothetical protein VGF47_00545 [Solirubrobacteraceae bacterium]|jgi:hypothetical protein
MTDFLMLLDRATQSQLREAASELEDAPDSWAGMQPEALAALAIVGGHPPQLRRSTLAIVPIAAREQMYANRLVECDDSDPDHVVWSLSKVGEELAGRLAAAAPALTEAEEREAEQSLQAMLAEAEQSLGLNPAPADTASGAHAK